MQIKVLKVFKDKETNKIHSVGDVVEVTEERGGEIIMKGFAAAYTPPKKGEQKK